MDANKDNLKIIELRGENFKKIKAIVIRPDDDLVLLTGKNAMGKSSAIDLIIAMLCGKNSKMIPQPIRKGQTHADGRLDLGKFIVTVKWTEKGRELRVTSADGAVWPNEPLSPQAMLDSFVGELSFDLGKFIEMEDKERTELFLQLAGLDFSPIDREIERLVEERRQQGIKTKMFNSQREVIPPEKSMCIPKELINTSELNEEYKEATENNYEIERACNLHRTISENIGVLKEEIKKKEKSLLEVDIIRGKQVMSTDILKVKIEGAEEQNELFRANERNKIADQKHKYELSIYEKQTAKITELRKSKDKALQEAILPLPGLTVTSEGTFYNDTPINQLASSEQMKVAMSAAMEQNYKLKVILVKNASLLDKENIEVIREMAKDKGYMVWLEQVDTTREGEKKVGFYFVDGEITKIDGEEVKDGQ